MKRRDFLEIAGVGAAACMLTDGSSAEARAQAGESEANKLATPCGIYCGICPEYLNGKCHGVCGCRCGQCTGAKAAQACDIARCVFGRKLQSCADCPELPCTQLIQAANDPVWRTGGPMIENLRRRKRIGTEAWLAEQKQYWSNKEKRERWLALFRECAAKDRTLGK